MNLPNKLSILRLILTPIFLATLVIDFEYHFFIALIIFMGASITDYFDGKIARSRNLVTDFGKFVDPLADKMLVISALLGFTYLNIGFGILVATFIIIMREFVITSLRTIAASKGVILAANFWGKLKTVTQMLAIICVLLFSGIIDTFAVSDTTATVLQGIYNTLIWLSLIMAIISGVIYLYQNRKCISEM